MKKMVKVYPENKKNNRSAAKWKNWAVEWAVKWVTPKNIAIFLTLVYVFTLLPLLWIAKYNYPSADDYTNGAGCRQVWMMHHSVLRVMAEAFSRTVQEWFTWRGCFTSSFLSALTPNIWGESWYMITPLAVFFLLSFSTVYLFHAILVKALGMDKYISYGVAMAVLFLSVQCMPDAGRAESFYWYSGAINYVFLHGLSLLYYGLLISIVSDTGKKRTWDLCAASLLGFLVAGGNQMTMLNVAVVSAAAVFFLIKKGRRDCKILAVPIGIFCLGFLLSVIAPGNFARAGASAGMNPVKAILVSFYYGLDMAMGQWTTWPVLIFAFFLAVLFWGAAEKTDFTFPYPLAVVGFSYCLVCAMFTPPLFVMGNIEAGRLQGLAFLMYILLLALSVGYVAGWARKKYDGRQEGMAACGVNDGQEAVSGNIYDRNECLCLLLSVGFLLFGSMLTVIPEPRCYTAASALTDLLSGDAETYGREQKERIALYNSGNESGQEKILEVDPLTAHPEVLFFSDISEDAEDWTNKGLARFYNLRGVKVKHDK